MTDLEALVALNTIEGIGSTILSRLLKYFSKPQDVFSASPAQLQCIGGIDAVKAQRIRSFDTCVLGQEFESARKLGVDIVSYLDKGYPLHLTSIPGFPIILYIKGAITKEDAASVAIVGSRQASLYGLMSAQKFAFGLCSRGLTVVSGLARGIDTYAHRGALCAQGRTIAVLGSGFGYLYPQENAALAQEIQNTGAVISEFPLNTPPLKQNFPRRNRVISGLSLGVVVVEAASNSGALITADFALEQGKDVFALPGQVDSQRSFGTNRLIQQGAKLVTCIDDIIEELNPFVASEHCARIAGDTLGREDSMPQESPKDESHALCALFCDDQALAIDEIAEKSNLSIPALSGILLRLEMQKSVVALPGKKYRRNTQA